MLNNNHKTKTKDQIKWKTIEAIIIDIIVASISVIAIMTATKLFFGKQIKAAINYADAVVVAEEGANQELIDFAYSNKKHVIEYTPMPELADKLSELYDKIAILDED